MVEAQKGNAMNDILYECCPEKNTECEKTRCQTLCFHTTNPDYSVDGKRYKFNVNTGELEDMDA